MDCLDPYAPINTLKPVADEVWIVDGPIIRMGYFGLPFSIPFPTRMTIVRLPDGGLWLHSPTELTEPLLAEVVALGAPRFLIAPNRLHFWWLKDWAHRFPGAQVLSAPGVAEAATARMPVNAEPLAGEALPEAWQGVFDQVLIPGAFLSEAVFFHRPTRTAILVDLVQSFERSKVRCRPFWWAIRLAGCAAPQGGTPLDLRSTFWPRMAAVRSAVQQIVAWQPERVIIAHGRWFARDGTAALRRALAWAL